jgi:hypothetical protein
MSQSFNEFNMLSFKDRIETLNEHSSWVMRIDSTSNNGRRVRRDLFAIEGQFVDVWFNDKYKPYVVRMLSYWELDSYLEHIHINDSVL